MHEFIYPLRISYEDTDFNGYVYFPNYLKYMERAVTNLIYEKGIRMTDLIKQDILIGVRSVQCKYFRPAQMEDEVEVVSKIHSHTEVIITWDHTIRSQKDKNYIYCHGLIENVCFHRQQLKPMKLLPELRELINKYAI